MPNRSDYEMAVRRLDLFACDSLIRGASVEYQSNQLYPKMYSGGRAVVYPIEAKGKRYALKCWIQDIGNLADRYRAVDLFLRQNGFTYMVESVYYDSEILVDGNRYPALLMEWVEAPTLKQWIDSNMGSSSLLEGLADKFLQMVQAMHAHDLSHGDLQHENILVCSDGSLKLVDYDSFYIPGLDHLTDDIKGLPGFQHPSRNDLARCSRNADYFSELVIYLSLKALALKSDLWDAVKGENRLLVSEQDIISPSSSELVRTLRGIRSLKSLADVFCEFCAADSLDRLRPLEAVVRPAGSGSAPVGNAGKRTSEKKTTAVKPPQTSSAKPASPSGLSELRNFSTWQPESGQSGQDVWRFSPSSRDVSVTGRGKGPATAGGSVSSSESSTSAAQSRQPAGQSASAAPAAGSANAPSSRRFEWSGGVSGSGDARNSGTGSPVDHGSSGPAAPARKPEASELPVSTASPAGVGRKSLGARLVGWLTLLGVVSGLGYVLGREALLERLLPFNWGQPSVQRGQGTGAGTLSK